jgi:H3 lysine-79-specific histone-lysine N-methyltransferase
MNIFKSKKFSVQRATPTIRLERVPDVKKPAPLPSKVASTKSKQVQQASPSRESPSTARSSPARSSSDGHGSSRLRPGKRKASEQRLDTDSEDDGATEELDDPLYKRQKTSRSIDLKRRLRSRRAFSEADGRIFEMIHAADISSATKKSKLAVTVPVEHVTVELQYPSASQRERFVMELYLSNGTKAK